MGEPRDWYVIDVETDMIVHVIHAADGQRPTGVPALALGGGTLRLDECPTPAQLEEFDLWRIRT